MLDRVELNLKAGDGGRGAITFRHEKFVPFGGPFGGDGGKGGDVVVKADASLSTLRPFQHRRSFRADNGHGGMTKNKHGADAPDLVLAVPPGTLVYRKNEDGGQELIADLEKEGQQVVAARGGNGGFGNIHFASATNQAPRIAQPGVQGQTIGIVLELRLIADAGIIGYPNVGKSSLLAALTAANPKIANYPFTTLEPILGVVKSGQKTFVLAEIPGLIEGAHEGKGLGISFLRHAMRTKVLIHLLDGGSASPLDDFIKVNNELSLFDASLAKRPQVVAINKMDIEEVRNRAEALRSSFADAGLQPVFISAMSGEGLEELIGETLKLLKASDIKLKVTPPGATKVFRPQPLDRAAALNRKENSFILFEPELERLLDQYDLEDTDQWPEFYQQLDRLGIKDLLKASGVKSGDTIITGNKKWKYYSDEYRHPGWNV